MSSSPSKSIRSHVYAIYHFPQSSSGWRLANLALISMSLSLSRWLHRNNSPSGLLHHIRVLVHPLCRNDEVQAVSASISQLVRPRFVATQVPQAKDKTLICFRYLCDEIETARLKKKLRATRFMPARGALKPGA